MKRKREDDQAEEKAAKYRRMIYSFDDATLQKMCESQGLQSSGGHEILVDRLTKAAKSRNLAKAAKSRNLES